MQNATTRPDAKDRDEATKRAHNKKTPEPAGHEQGGGREIAPSRKGTNVAGKML
jgi:hypothetical protein